jgi:hypothetical protein
MKNIDWKNLGFAYMDTNCHIRYVWRDGKWDAGELVQSPYMPIHIAATALHYGQAAFEGLKAFCRKDGKVSLFRPAGKREADGRHGAPDLHGRSAGGDVRGCVPARGEGEPRVRAALRHGRVDVRAAAAVRQRGADRRGPGGRIHVPGAGDARGRLLQGRAAGGEGDRAGQLRPRGAAGHGAHQGGRQLRGEPVSASRGEARGLSRGALSRRARAQVDRGIRDEQLPGGDEGRDVRDGEIRFDPAEHHEPDAARDREGSGDPGGSAADRVRRSDELRRGGGVRHGGGDHAGAPDRAGGPGLQDRSGDRLRPGAGEAVQAVQGIQYGELPDTHGWNVEVK